MDVLRSAAATAASASKSAASADDGDIAAPEPDAEAEEDNAAEEVAGARDVCGAEAATCHSPMPLSMRAGSLEALMLPSVALLPLGEPEPRPERGRDPYARWLSASCGATSSSSSSTAACRAPALRMLLALAES